MIKYLFIIVLVFVNILLICKMMENSNKREKYQSSSGSACNPDDADISGSTVIDCVTRCKNNSSDHCGKDSNGNPIDIIPPAQQFLNNYPNIDKNPPGISDESNIELQKQSVCLQRCLSCGWNNDGNNCKCSWSNDCLRDAAANYDVFKKNWNAKDFRIGAIPEDKKITISWNESLAEADVDSYILYIFQKNNVGQVLTKKINHIDLVKNQNNNIYIIDGLLNNVQYGIQLNKLSKSFPGKTKLVKTSNTIYGVPSEVNLLNFSNINSSQKECESLAENLLDNFVGREFEINLG